MEMPAPRRIRPQGVKLRSVVEKPLQLLKLVSEVWILADFALDLADRVQDRRVVPAAEPPPDFGEGTRGQMLREIHSDLAGPYVGTMTTLRQQISLRDAVV